VDPRTLKARAELGLEDSAGTPRQGVDGLVQPSLSAIDAFVSSLQLAQVLMYELDGVTRAESNTLWMLHTSLELPAVPRPVAERTPVTCSIARKHLLPLRGATWRNVDIAGDCGGVSLRCSFAHELPASAVSPAR
jgi:hypothetical protein